MDKVELYKLDREQMTVKAVCNGFLGSLADQLSTDAGTK